MDRQAFLGSVGVLALCTGCIGESPSDSPNSSPIINPSEPPTPRIPTTNRSPLRTDTPADELFQMESKYTEAQKIIAVNHQEIVNTRDISYRNSTRRSSTDSTSIATEISAESPDQTAGDDSITGSVGAKGAIQIWNNSNDTRSIAITIEVSDRPADPLEQETCVEDSPKNPILNEMYSIDPDTHITVQLLKPGDYVVSVGVADRQPTENIDFTTDNCNMQGLSVGVMSDGSVDYFALSTSMACVSPTTDTTDTTARGQDD